MAAIQDETGEFVDVRVKRSQVFVFDVHRIAAVPTVEVMVVVGGGLVDNAPAADMGYQHEALLGEEVQVAVNGSLGKVRDDFAGALVNL